MTLTRSSKETIIEGDIMETYTLFTVKQLEEKGNGDYHLIRGTPENVAKFVVSNDAKYLLCPEIDGAGRDPTRRYAEGILAEGHDTIYPQPAVEAMIDRIAKNVIAKHPKLTGYESIIVEDADTIDSVVEGFSKHHDSARPYSVTTLSRPIVASPDQIMYVPVEKKQLVDFVKKYEKLMRDQKAQPKV